MKRKIRNASMWHSITIVDNEGEIVETFKLDYLGKLANRFFRAKRRKFDYKKNYSTHIENEGTHKNNDEKENLYNIGNLKSIDNLIVEEESHPKIFDDMNFVQENENYALYDDLFDLEENEFGFETQNMDFLYDI